MRFARCGCCFCEPEAFSAELCVTSVFSVLRETLLPPASICGYNQLHPRASRRTVVEALRFPSPA